MVQRRSGRSVDARRVSAAVAYVFACGPWLPKVFSDLKGAIQPTRQEVFFFGTPSGDGWFSEGTMPAWVDFGPRLFYGIPGSEGGGFADLVLGRAKVDPFFGLARLAKSSARAGSTPETRS